MTSIFFFNSKEWLKQDNILPTDVVLIFVDIVLI